MMKFLPTRWSHGPMGHKSLSLQDEVPVSDSGRLEKLKKLRLLPLRARAGTRAGPPGLDAAERGAVAEEGL